MASRAETGMGKTAKGRIGGKTSADYSRFADLRSSGLTRSDFSSRAISVFAGMSFYYGAISSGRRKYAQMGAKPLSSWAKFSKFS
ncbi:hypothetical protein D9M68_754570 [compost metagenome]